MLRNIGEEDEDVGSGGTGGRGDASVSGLVTVLLQEYDADSLREGDKVHMCSLLARKLPPSDPTLQLHTVNVSGQVEAVRVCRVSVCSCNPPTSVLAL